MDKKNRGRVTPPPYLAVVQGQHTHKKTYQLTNQIRIVNLVGSRIGHVHHIVVPGSSLDGYCLGAEYAWSHLDGGILLAVVEVVFEKLKSLHIEHTCTDVVPEVAADLPTMFGNCGSSEVCSAETRCKVVESGTTAHAVDAVVGQLIWRAVGTGLSLSVGEEEFGITEHLVRLLAQPVATYSAIAPVVVGAIWAFARQDDHRVVLPGLPPIDKLTGRRLVDLGCIDGVLVSPQKSLHPPPALSNSPVSVLIEFSSHPHALL